jgi:hypothetical protein
MVHKIIIHAIASLTTDPNTPTGASVAIAALDDLLLVVDAVGLVLTLILAALEEEPRKPFDIENATRRIGSSPS